jgi:DNA-binding NtrC family response regulator
MTGKRLDSPGWMAQRRSVGTPAGATRFTAFDIVGMTTANPSLEGLRILLAEDEGLIALELETVLEGFGCEVVGPVSRVSDVLREAEHGGLDGALLDVNLRGEQIFAILPRLIELQLKIVITSGYDDASLYPQAFRALPRLAKPFDERALRRICERTFLAP